MHVTPARGHASMSGGVRSSDADRRGPAARPGRPPARRRARACTCRSGGCTSPSCSIRPRGCRVASCCSPPACSSTRRAQQREFVARLADHHLAGLGFGTGFKHAEVPPPLLEVAAEREFPVFEVPYEVPFIAVTEAAFTQLVNEQYAVLRRALGRSGAARADRPVRAGSRCAGRRAGDADRRRRARVRRARRAARSSTRSGARSSPRCSRRCATRCTSGPAGARRGRSCPRWSTATRGSRCRWPPTGRRGRPSVGRPGACAGGVAGRDQGRRPAVGLRPADPAPGGDDRRARAAALARRRRHRAPARRRRARRDRPRRADRRGAGAPARAVRALRIGGRDRPRAGRRRARVAAPVEAALSAALRDEAAPALVASVGSLACALVAGRRRRRAVRARRAGRGARPAPSCAVEVRVGVGRAVPGRRRAAELPRGAVRARGARVGGAASDGNGNGSAPAVAGDRRGSPRTRTSGRSSCCCRSRTTRRCGCSATRSSGRSRPARVPTVAS